MRNLQPWCDRRDAVNNQLNQFISWLDNRRFPRRPTLLYLARNLQSFMQRQFARVEMLSGTVNPTYLDDWGYNLIFDQVSFDLAVIQQAALQRMADDLALKLDDCDQKAWLALKPALPWLKFGEKQTVLTYFNKSLSIRLIPYAPVALIGIPATGLAKPRDWLAIPHEVGHHVYWNARIPADKGDAAAEKISVRNYLRRHLQVGSDNGELNADQYVRRWTEEAFADIFGFKIAGPAVAYSSMEVYNNFHSKAFYKDDGEHPPAALRPLVYTKLLGGDPFAADVDTQWMSALAQRQALFPSTSGEISLYDPAVSKAVAQVISPGVATNPAYPLDALIAELQQIDVFTNLQVEWWNQYPRRGASTILEDFEIFFAAPTGLPVEDLDNVVSTEVFPEYWWNEFPDPLMPSGLSPAQAEAWWNIFLKFEYWAVRGTDKDPLMK